MKFVDYNFTSANVLNLNWILHLNKTIGFHSLVIFEGANMRMRLEKSSVSLNISHNTSHQANVKFQLILVELQVDDAR